MEFKTLKDAVKLLNQEKETKLKFVGIKTSQLVKDFVDACEDFELGELPEIVVNVYNELTGKEDESKEQEQENAEYQEQEDAEDTEEPVKEKKKSKKEKKSKKTKQSEETQEKEYKKSDYISAMQELVDKLELEDDDDEPIEVPNKMKEVKKKILETVTLVMDEGIDLKDAEISKETQEIMDYLFKLRASKEEPDEELKRTTQEIIDKEEGNEPVKSKKKVKEKKSKESKEEPKKEKKKTVKAVKNNKITKTQFVANLIEKGTYTQKEIIKIAENEMNIPKSSVTTMINHGKTEKKNSQYKPFKGRLIVIDEKKRVCFE